MAGGIFLFNAANTRLSAMIEFISACAIFIISIRVFCDGRSGFSIGILGIIENTILDVTSPF